MTILIALYVLAVWWGLKTWRSLPAFEPDREETVPLRLSVIVAVRNEAANIKKLLDGLAAQTYSREFFEVIIVDDHSEDGTPDIIRAYPAPFQRSVLPASGEGKKAAIRQGVEQATGEWVVTTDGDCIPGSDWLQAIAQFCTAYDPVFISGPVVLDGARNVFENLQTIEMASLIGAGAVSMELGAPTMCNGANIAYRRSLFDELGGFEGNEQVASGDDEFLMHKAAKAYPGRVLFLKSAAAIVRTAPQATLRRLYHQRKRWASKWGAYTRAAPRWIALFVFVFHLLFLLTMVLVLAGKYPLSVFLVQAGLKVGVEFAFLRTILLFLKKRITIFHFTLLQVIYAPYVVFFALAGRAGAYSWKGREIQ